MILPTIDNMSTKLKQNCANILEIGCNLYRVISLWLSNICIYQEIMCATIRYSRTCSYWLYHEIHRLLCSRNITQYSDFFTNESVIEIIACVFFVWDWWVNTFRPDDIHMRQWAGSSLVPVMAWRLLCTNPLPQALFTFNQLDPWAKHSVKFGL